MRSNRLILPGLLFLLLAGGWGTAFGAGLKSGPMLGYSTMAEVLIWVQTDEPAEVQVRYWRQSNPAEVFYTDKIVTAKSTNYIAHCIADRVTEGGKYSYTVLIDGVEAAPKFRDGYKQKGPIPLFFQTPPKWRHTEATGNSPPDFRVATGSCANISEPDYGWEEPRYRGGDYQIFESIYEKHPDIMVWMGDNIYLSEEDSASLTGMYHRYDHMRALPQLRALLATTHNLATWDDHDYGPNNAGYEYWNKEASLETFKLYWGNPSYGFKDMPGVMTFFNWGDVNFYILDNRYYRTTDQNNPEPFGIEKRQHGRKQVDWLVDSMSYWQSQSGFPYPVSFHIIVTGDQVLSDSGNPDGYRSYEKEWQYMIDRIMHAGIDGVVFLTGDVHNTELSREVRTGGGRPGIPGQAGEAGKPYVFYDLTVSPFTSEVNNRLYPNSHRVDIFPDTDYDIIAQKNFATLDFKGPKDDRRMEIRIYDSDGGLLNGKPDGVDEEISDVWVLKANDLKVN